MMMLLEPDKWDLSMLGWVLVFISMTVAAAIAALTLREKLRATLPLSRQPDLDKLATEIAQLKANTADELKEADKERRASISRNYQEMDRRFAEVNRNIEVMREVTARSREKLDLTYASVCQTNSQVSNLVKSVGEIRGKLSPHTS